MTFLQALSRRGITYRVHGTRSEKVSFNCPFCVERGKPADTQKRLCVSLTEFWGKCVHCDWKRRHAIKAVLYQFNIHDNVSEYNLQEDSKPKPKVQLPDDFQLLTKVYDELDRSARRYILGRGITKEQIRENKIGVSYSGKYRYRIIFPVYVAGELRAFNSRDFTDTLKPKYLNSQGDKFLFHFDSKAETVILSEGVIKALRIAQISAFCSASLLGHDLTEHQLIQIQKSKCQHIIIYPDPDPVGKRGAVKVADKLCEFWSGRVSFVHPVSIPADEIPLADLKNLLDTKLIKFTGLTRPRLFQ